MDLLLENKKMTQNQAITFTAEKNGDDEKYLCENCDDKDECESK